MRTGGPDPRGVRPDVLRRGRPDPHRIPSHGPPRGGRPGHGPSHPGTMTACPSTTSTIIPEKSPVTAWHLTIPASRTWAQTDPTVSLKPLVLTLSAVRGRFWRLRMRTGGPDPRGVRPDVLRRGRPDPHRIPSHGPPRGGRPGHGRSRPVTMTACPSTTSTIIPEKSPVTAWHLTIPASRTWAQMDPTVSLKPLVLTLSAARGRFWRLRMRTGGPDP